MSGPQTGKDVETVRHRKSAGSSYQRGPDQRVDNQMGEDSGAFKALPLEIDAK